MQCCRRLTHQLEPKSLQDYLEVRMKPCHFHFRPDHHSLVAMARLVDHVPHERIPSPGNLQMPSAPAPVPLTDAAPLSGWLYSRPWPRARSRQQLSIPDPWEEDGHSEEGRVDDLIAQQLASRTGSAVPWAWWWASSRHGSSLESVCSSEICSPEVCSPGPHPWPVFSCGWPREPSRLPCPCRAVSHCC